MEIILIGLLVTVSILFSQVKNLKEKLAQQEKSSSQSQDKIDTIWQRLITNEAMIASLVESYKFFLAVRGTTVENTAALSIVGVERATEQPFKDLSMRKKKWLMIRCGMNKDLEAVS